MKKTGLEIVEARAKGMVYKKIGLLGDIYVWNNNNYSYERKDGERLYILNLLNEKFEIIEESKVWKPKLGEGYWNIDEFGDVVYRYWNNDSYDNASYELGNCFKTKEEAQKALEKIKIYVRLKRYALEHNTEKIDWNNLKQSKYHIKVDNNKINIWESVRVKHMNQVYFTSEELCEQAIEEIGEDNIKKLFEE